MLSLPKELRAALEQHRKSPDVTLEEHIRRRRIELGKSLNGRAKIYLDKRYWILIRDAELNRSSDRESPKLLEQLRRLAGSGRAFCPISEAVLIELLKQTDLNTRRQTAALIDELSLGVSLAPEDERVGTELAHLLYASRDPGSVYKRDWLVWLKVCYAATMVHPSSTGLPPDEELVLQKAFFDHIWGMTLCEFIDELGAARLPSLEPLQSLAEKLNHGNLTHAQEVNSFKQAYVAEIYGALGGYTAIAQEVLARLYERQTGAKQSWSEEMRREAEHVLQGALANAMRLGKLCRELPTLHVSATCHAAYRWDKNRRYEANDIFDFHHATAALGYCDVFLTEKDLCAMLTAGHVRLDAQLECVVLSDIGEALQHVTALSGPCQARGA